MTTKVPSEFLSAGTIVQVVGFTKTDTFTTTSTTYTDITGFSASITPSSTSSKILVKVHIAYGCPQNNYGHGRILRDSTVIGVGDSGLSSQFQGSIPVQTESTGSTQFKTYISAMEFLDSPSSTSSLTYKVQVAVPYSSGTKSITINKPHNNTNAVYIGRYISTINLYEVLA